MKNLKYFIVFVAVFFIVTFKVSASISKDLPVTLTQPDGTTLNVFASGDEYFNYYHDINGNIILKDNKTGYYVYSSFKNNDFTATSLKARRSIYEISLNADRIYSNVVNESDFANMKSYFDSIEKQRNDKESKERSEYTKENVTPITKLNNIVINIRFRDDAEFLDPTSTKYFHDIFNGTSNSVRNYYNEVSYGKTDIQSYFFPGNESTDYSYMDSHDRSYYQPYSATNPNGYTDVTLAFREHQLIKNAIESVRSSLPTNVDFDSNNDGLVDNITFIVAGNAEGWSDLLWAHQWALFSDDVYINGLKVWTYNFEPTNQVDVTTASHEMFHTLGAPDLYHYNADFWYDTPIGPWDLMEYGAGHMSAYMKYRYGGWISTIPTITKDGSYSLSDLRSSTNNAFKIPTENPNEYYIVEYRNQVGTYESQLPQSGLVVYRINELAYPLGNVYYGQYPDEVYVIRPNGLASDTWENLYNAALNELNPQKGYTQDEIYLSDKSSSGITINNVKVVDNKIQFDVSMNTVQFSLSEDLQYYKNIKLKLSTTDGKEIRYTIDGTEPTSTSPLYKTGDSILLSQTTTVKAKAFSGTTSSETVTKTYQIVNTISVENPYLNNTNKLWDINLSDQAGDSTVLTFDYFNTEENYDYLFFYNYGLYPNEPMFASVYDYYLTGALPLNTIIKVPSKQYTLRFSSDGAMNDLGFRISSINTFESQIIGQLTNVVDNETVSGKKIINGYFVSDFDNDQIKIYIDNKEVNLPITRSNNTNLTSQYPTMNTYNSNFSFEIDTTKYTDGIHDLQVALRMETTGKVLNLTSKLNIKNTPTYDIKKLGPITNFKVNSLSTNGVQLAWTKITEATGYNVYRSTTKDGTYSYIGYSSTTTYSDSNLTPGQTYYYKIRAYKNIYVGTTKYKFYGEYSPIISAKPVPSIPGSFKTSSASYNSITVSYSSVSGVSGYEIYRATSSTGTFSLIKTTTATSYTDPSLTTNKTYYYKVRAYKTVGTTRVYGSYTSVQSAKPIPSIPGSFKASSSSYNSITVSYSSVSGVSGYEIYRATSSTGTYSLIKTTTATSYTNTSLTTNKTYYYKVRAYKTVGTTKVYGSYTSVQSAKPVPSIPGSLKVFSASYNSIKVSFSSVSGASGYEIYRATSSTGTYSLIKTTTATSYTNTSLTTNKTYYYKVRAYRLVGTTKVYSSYTSVQSVKPIPSTPSNFKATRLSTTSIKTTWSSVSGASGYEIYRATSSTGTYSLIKTTTSLSYTNTSLTSNKAYYYKIRAYRYVGSVKVYSNYTTYVYVK